MWTFCISWKELCFLQSIQKETITCTCKPRVQKLLPNCIYHSPELLRCCITPLRCNKTGNSASNLQRNKPELSVQTLIHFKIVSVMGEVITTFLLPFRLSTPPASATRSSTYPPSTPNSSSSSTATRACRATSSSSTCNSSSSRRVCREFF